MIGDAIFQKDLGCTLSINCSDWTREVSIKSRNTVPFWKPPTKKLSQKWSIYHGSAVTLMESRGFAPREILWGHLFILCKTSMKHSFSDIEHPGRRSRADNTQQWHGRNKNRVQSAVLLPRNSQALLAVCTTAGYIFLSPLPCPGCIKWIKALRAAKHIFISSTLRVRAADSILWSVTKSLDHLSRTKGWRLKSEVDTIFFIKQLWSHSVCFWFVKALSVPTNLFAE